MKKGNLDDALRILGFDINDDGSYAFSTGNKEDTIEEDVAADEEEYEDEEYLDEESESGEEDEIEGDLVDEAVHADEDPGVIEESTDIGAILIPPAHEVRGSLEDIPIGMPGDKKLTLEEAVDFVREMLLGDAKSILDVGNNAKMSECLIMIADKVNDLTYKSNPDYVGKVRALEQKIENYKKEFGKAKDLERKLYLIASAEERFAKHISEFGYEDIVLRDMSKATSSWQEYIMENTGIDLNETRDIGEILLALKERTIKNGK